LRGQLTYVNQNAVSGDDLPHFPQEYQAIVMIATPACLDGRPACHSLGIRDPDPFNSRPSPGSICSYSPVLTPCTMHRRDARQTD